MKLYVVDIGWRGAAVFAANSRDEAIEKYLAKYPDGSGEPFTPITRSVVEEKLKEYEITSDLWVETEGEG